MARDIIAQVVNQGSDVHEDNFDIQTADGGFGIFDACVGDGGVLPQYGGSGSVWGDNLGGVRTRAECSNLPAYPICKTSQEDNLQTLCQWSFDNKVRLEGGTTSNPTITKLCYVACPSELYEATGLRRADETTSSFTCTASSTLPAGGSLTRMMDCGKNKEVMHRILHQLLLYITTRTILRIYSFYRNHILYKILFSIKYEF